MRTNDALVCMNDLPVTGQVSWLMRMNDALVRMNDAFVRTSAALVRMNDSFVRTKGGIETPSSLQKSGATVKARGSWDPGS